MATASATPSLTARMLMSLVRIVSGVPIVSLLICGLLFLSLGATWKGRCVGLSAVLLAGLTYGPVGYWSRDWFKRRRRRIYAVLLPSSLVLYLVPMVLAPDGGTSDEGSARNRFLDGQRAFPRYSPWNVIPEVDQISVATSLLPWRDPYVDLAKAERVWSLVAPLYDEMEQDADFHSLGSVMGMGYRELVRMEFRTGHYFVLVSEAPGRGRLPCLIYLHGLGGNRKAHLWALSRIIRQTPCVLVAPTFGLGNWDKTGGAELVVDVAREVSATLPVDPDQFFLLGYSLGAKGVTRAVVQEPDLFRGLVYLSPVTEDKFFSSPQFLSNRSRKLLFLYGGQDERIPQQVVSSTAALLQRYGYDVQLKIYDDEDHYLILSQREAVTDDIMEWMQGDE